MPEPATVPVAIEFARRARECPHQQAVTQSGLSWTYEELLSRSAAMAGTLLAHGLQRTDVVAVSSPRGVGLIAGVVGVFMSGGVLLTLDRNLPVNRQRLVLNEARARYLLYIGEWRSEDDWLRHLPGLEIISVSGQTDWTATPVRGLSLPEISSNDPAYIFFTSGTTGIPKGVVNFVAGPGGALGRAMLASPALRAISFTGPTINLGEPFQHQCAVINVLRYWHQIHRMLRFADGQLLLAQSRIDLSKDSNRPRVFRFDDQSLSQNFSTFAERSRCTRQLVISPTTSSFGLRQSISWTVLNSPRPLPALPNRPMMRPSSSIL
jgi:acyl-CoA synthetase (AMP-forming)/AMP-acid ligase II